jgi:glycosyltransferase involved in cell wall biosynthesis
MAAGSKAAGFGALAMRFHPELAPANSRTRQSRANGEAEIVSWNLSTLWRETISRRKRKATAEETYSGFIDTGRRFSVKVREALKRRSDLGPDSIFFAYDTGAFEALEWCRQQGLKCVLNQMDPNRVEAELVRAEEQRWPGWALSAIDVPHDYFVRREQEWALAHKVVVNSEFSRQALIQQGVPSEKLVVVPLCYEADAFVQPGEIANRKPAQPLRVLFLGQVILRKGIQYLLAAARELEQENIHFDVVGPIGISKKGLANAPGNVTFHGRTGRDQIAKWYWQSHLFVLPTLSDGFALTQLEAMAYGLPVIATPCCGDVVTDGVDGFVVAPRDAAALARTFQRYLAQPDLLASQSAAALEKAKQFSLDRLAQNLMRLETQLR